MNALVGRGEIFFSFYTLRVQAAEPPILGYPDHFKQPEYRFPTVYFRMYQKY